MRRLGERTGGILILLIGLALTVYSFPFVTWVAFAVFLVGLAGIVTGVWWMAHRAGASS